MIDEEAYAHYYTLRTHARKRVVASINRTIKSEADREVWKGITLGSIDAAAIEFARLEWPKHDRPAMAGEPLPYSWERLLHKFTAVAANFNIAVWHTRGEEKFLHGLALGKPSKGQTHLTINWIERSYAPTYLRGGVLLPILASAEEYARLLKCERVLIKDPVAPEPFARYGYSAFEHQVRGSYLSKEL